MTIELDTTLAQAEVLFLSFRQIVADLDKRKAEQLDLTSTSSSGMRHRLTSNSARLAATNLTAFEIPEELRELLTG